MSELVLRRGIDAVANYFSYTATKMSGSTDNVKKMDEFE